MTLSYMLIMLLLITTAYTVFSMPYLALSVDLANHYHQRNYLLSFRAIGIAVGGLVGGGSLL
ncbi:MFS transporter [Saccharophagus degradans]|uniref:MFS transporter n=1 Tax=Saccharophagus degradans TaxID=86304 RepID=UPI003A801742